MAIAPEETRDLPSGIVRHAEAPVSWTQLRGKLAEFAAHMRWGWDKSLEEDQAQGWPRP